LYSAVDAKMSSAGTGYRHTTMNNFVEKVKVTVTQQNKGHLWNNGQ